MNISSLCRRDFLYYWLPPLVWCGVILIISGDLGAGYNSLGLMKSLLSWLPDLGPDRFDLINFYIRKGVGHFGNYGFLYFLWFRTFQGNLGYRPGRAFLYSLTLCLGLALLDEGHQALTTSRVGSFWDVALDMTGASTAALVIIIFWVPRSGAPAGK